MEHQAACLGLLIDKGLDFKKVAKEIDEMNKERQLDVDFCDIIAKHLIDCIVLMEIILNKITAIDVEKGDMPSGTFLFGENWLML